MVRYLAASDRWPSKGRPEPNERSPVGGMKGKPENWRRWADQRGPTARRCNSTRAPGGLSMPQAPWPVPALTSTPPAPRSSPPRRPPESTNAGQDMRFQTGIRRNRIWRVSVNYRILHIFCAPTALASAYERRMTYRGTYHTLFQPVSAPCGECGTNAK